MTLVTGITLSESSPGYFNRARMRSIKSKFPVLAPTVAAKVTKSSCLLNFISLVLLCSTSFGQSVSSSPSHHDRAQQCYKDQNWTCIIDETTQALSQDPHDADSCLLRGIARTHSNNDDAAILDFSQVLSMNPAKYSEAHLERGKAYLRKHNFQVAADDLDAASKSYPNDPRVWANLANAERGLHHPEPVIVAFTQSILLDPNFKFAHFFRAEAYREIGLYYKALDDLNFVIGSPTSSPNDATTDESELTKLTVDFKALLCKTLDEARIARPSGCAIHISPGAGVPSIQSVPEADISFREKFSRAFDAIFDSANDKAHQFESVIGRYDPERGAFASRVELPLVPSQSCAFDREGRQGRWRFYCKVETGPTKNRNLQKKAKRSKRELVEGERPSMKKIYLDLVNAVIDVRKDLSILAPDSAPAPGTLSTTFVPRYARDHRNLLFMVGGFRSAIFAWGDSNGAEWLIVDIEGDAVVKPNPVLAPIVSSTANAIDSEISASIVGGRYSALPTPQTSKDGGTGVALVSILNSTQYALSVLVSGPSSARYSILPGTSEQLTLRPVSIGF